MLAARMYGINDLRVEEVPKPKVGKNEILLKIKAAAICGTDVRMLTAGANGIDADHPLTLGHEFAGVIDEVGENVTAYQVGMRVVVAPNIGCGTCDMCVSGNGHLCPDYRALGVNTDGGFAEYMLIPENAVRSGNVTVLPDNVSFIAGALNEPFSCALNGSEHCHIQPGDFVLIVGAGVIGLMHAKLAKMAGAGNVVVSDLVEERLEQCKKIDPDFITVGLVDDAKVKELTGKHGFDIIITACPSPAAQKAAFGQAAVNGRVCFFGGLPKGKEFVELNSNIIHYKQLVVTGTTRASITQYRKTLGFIANGTVKVDNLATKCAPITEIHELFELAKQAKGLKNVVLFD